MRYVVEVCDNDMHVRDVCVDASSVEHAREIVTLSPNDRYIVRIRRNDIPRRVFASDIMSGRVHTGRTDVHLYV